MMNKQVKKWDSIRSDFDLTDNDMFELFNIPVLDEAIEAKKVIHYSHNPKGNTGFLGQELEYLLENGYIFDKNTMTAIPLDK